MLEGRGGGGVEGGQFPLWTVRVLSDLMATYADKEITAGAVWSLRAEWRKCGLFPLLIIAELLGAFGSVGSVQLCASPGTLLRRL